MSAPVVPRDYNSWFGQQHYGPGAYPPIGTLNFLGAAQRMQYVGILQFQAETMRIHETILPTAATAYDITTLSRHVPGYWRMLLAYSKADGVWNRLYGNINTPRSYNSRWSRSKKGLRDLLILNQRAADSDAAIVAAAAAAAVAVAAAYVASAAEEENEEEREGEGEDEDEAEDEGSVISEEE
ncbi:hypothetical protein NHQ30_000692 [Ciborinia camelliae]|nr:hypothetical protein NHQ30_000692 [Ciborinia camelliae]